MHPSPWGMWFLLVLVSVRSSVKLGFKTSLNREQDIGKIIGNIHRTYICFSIHRKIDSDKGLIVGVS